MMGSKDKGMDMDGLWQVPKGDRRLKRLEADEWVAQVHSMC